MKGSIRMKYNPNSKMVSFRDSFRGYNKEDVNRYLCDMNRNFSQMEEDYKEEIAELKYKLKKIDDTAAEVTKASGENEIELLKTEISSLKAENDNLIKKIAEKEQTIIELNSAVKPEDDNIEKASKYDKMSNDIGNVFISANESAKAIVNEANKTAAKIKEEASEEAEKMKQDANEKITAAVDGVRLQIEELTRRYIDNYSMLSDELQNCIETVFNKSFTLADTKMSEACIKMETIKREAEVRINNEVNKI